MSAAASKLAEATEHQPAARIALESGVATPHHAYLLIGPSGTGKRAAARAFAAEILAGGSPDPDDARRRALATPSPHPDLVWLTPPGTQHLVDEVREQVIAAAGVSGRALTRLTPIVARLARLFRERDMVLAEINPLAELADGTFVAIDAHMDMENEARPRQAELLRELGSTSKPGGRIPPADMRQYLAAAMDNDLSESSVRGIAAEVRRKFGAGKVAEPKVA